MPAVKAGYRQTSKDAVQASSSRSRLDAEHLHPMIQRIVFAPLLYCLASLAYVCMYVCMYVYI